GGLGVRGDRRRSAPGEAPARAAGADADPARRPGNAGLSGRPWLTRLLALAAGAGAALAHPPFGLLPGLLGDALLLHLVDLPAERPLRAAFLRGWLAGVAYFAIAAWWVAEAFFVEAEAHAWMAPFAVVGMAGGLALFWGAAALAYRALKVGGISRL